MTVLVVLPSYNESANIVALVENLVSSTSNPDVCVVDDSSPDGTSLIVRDAIAKRNGWKGRVHLITRDGKGGRGSAVREGLSYGLKSQRYDRFVEMDCDFSHDPRDLDRGLSLIARSHDVAIGARYPDGTIVGWPISRRLFSRLSNLIARALLEWSIPDYTNGFRFYTERAVKSILAEPQRHSGYIYLSEALAVCLADGMNVISFPITFRNRVRGESNTNMREVANAFRGIVDVAKWYRTTKRTSR